MTQRWLSVEEIATHLGVSKDTIYAWREKKGLPAHKVGRFWKFKVDEVDSWVRNGSASEPSEGTSNE
ncbi:VrlI-like protein [Photobacterium sp. SKA34]|uniref:helix-turn-helix domain-containing protein n=1 Tax=Gammaproteobacteria TaxID=1236 RepID=UPI00006BEB36|nr:MULTISPECIES: helix-turn-helix domain-containing protein [Gammaproteobacteria]EAR55886.1 VrlI-like protein [Photobacterium sp. SKA34]PKG74691.1 DNA-binding protein [Shewanella sp. GutCb]